MIKYILVSDFKKPVRMYQYYHIKEESVGYIIYDIMAYRN